MPINFNINPYYDDFDPDKGFVRILFRPGFAVQARELTQLQTILQEQMKQFGTGIYEDGSVVYGGQTTYDSNVQFYKLQPTINGNTVTKTILDRLVGQSVKGLYNETFTDIEVTGRTVTSPSLTQRLVVGAQITVSTPAIESRRVVAISADGQSATLNLEFSDTVRTGTAVVGGETVNVVSGVDLTVSYETRAYCMKADEALGDGTPPILYLSTLDGPGISRNNQIFLVDENTTIDPPTVQVENTPTFTGDATAVHIDEGVFFINKFFVYIEPQTVIVGKSIDATYPPTKRVGLGINELIIDDGDDASLLDPAQGSYNYTAPGAHRFTIQLNLTTKEYYDETDPNADEIGQNADSDFVELMRVENGALVKQVKYPLYSVIGDELARRTKDIQGDFVIDPFLIETGPHPTDATKCQVKLDPGKAYVGGYEFATVGPTTLDVEKAREFGVAQDTDIGTTYGNYAVTRENIGRFDIGTHTTMDLLHMYASWGGYVLKIPLAEFNGDTLAQIKEKVKPGHYVAVSDTSGTNRPARFYGIVEDGGNVYISLEAYYDYAAGTPDYTFPTLNGLTGATQNYNISTLADPKQMFSGSNAVDTVLTDGSTTGTGQNFIVVSGSDKFLEIPTEAYNLFKVGTARPRAVRFFERDTDATHPLEVVVKNRVHIYDIKMTGASFDDVHSLAYTSAQASTRRVIGSGVIDEEDGRANQLADGQFGATRQIDSAFNTLIFPLPYEVIRSVRSDGLTAGEGGTGNLNYRYLRNYSNISVDSGSGETTLGTIQAPTSSTFYPSAQGVLSSLVAQQNYVVSINTGTFVPTSNTDVTFGPGDTLDLGTSDVLIDIPASNNGGDLRVRLDGTLSSGLTLNITTTLNFDNGEEKPKTLVQKYITFEDAPNTDILNLYTSDCYRIIGVWDSGDDQNPIDPADIGTYTINSDGELIGTDGTTVEYANIANKYAFYNGQMDNLYGHGNLKIKIGATKPTGQVTVLFEYFQHSNVAGNISGAFTVNSYDDIAYENIPSYVNTRGSKVELRDALDFRPRLRDATIPVVSGTAPTPDMYTVTANGGNVTEFEDVQEALLSIPTGTVDTDFSYFLSRIDRICISPDLELQVIKGKSALDPDTPSDIVGAMTIYFLYVPAYTFSCADLDPQFIENKRFTMKDLGNLEKRVSKVEFYTALSLLEKQAKDLSLFDENGNIILKTGILVDPFEGHSIGDVSNPDYDCSIDFAKSILRPPFTSQQVELEFDAANSSGVIKTGDVITLPYESRRLVNQPLTSKTINVNPYNVVNFLGSIELNPPSDDWIDTETRPALNVNLQGENDAWRALIAAANEGIRRSPRIQREFGFGTQWNDWEQTWTGTKKTSSTTTTNRWYESSFQYFVPGKGRPIRGNDVTRETFEISSTEVRTGIKSEFVPETITKDLGNRILSVSIVPYIRSRGVLFRARGLKPNTQVYPYFDKQDVTSSIIPSQEVSIGAFVGDAFEEYETIEAYLVDQNAQQVGDTLASAVLVSGFFENTDQLRYVNINKISSTFTGTGIEAFDPNNHPLVVNGTYILKIRGTNTTKFDAITGVTSARTVPTCSVISCNIKAVGDRLVTDSRGRVDGIFTIPNNDTQRFRTGERQFRLSDVAGTPELNNSQTNADVVYVASGIKQVRQGVTVSTRVPSISRTALTEERTTTDVVTRETRGPSRIVGWYDPLAETFLVDPVRNPDGVMLTAVDLFFKTKDENLPVQVQIRPTSNGYPSSNTVVPFGQVDIDPEDVVLPSNPNDNASVLEAPTRATFPAPVFLEPGEYAIVVLTNSLNYEAYISEMGQNVLGSNQRITKQPYNGSLFKSQNSSTWTAYQYEDLMFRLYRAEFDTTSTGYATFKSKEQASEIGFNLFQTQISVLNESSNTDVEFGYKSTDSVTNQKDGNYVAHVENQNVYLPREKYVDAQAGRFEIQGAMRSQSNTVSPLIDTQGVAMIAVGNYINNADLTNEDFLVTSPGSGFDPAAPPSTINGNLTISGGGGAGVVANAIVESDGTISGINVTVVGAGYVETPTATITATGGQVAPAIAVGGETNARGGNALSRYITRRVTLASGIESDNLKVLLNAYRPRDTRIEVYYKVLNPGDQTDFDDRPYVRMDQTETSSTIFSVTEKDVRELEFVPSLVDGERKITYTDDNGTVYSTFTTFAIKVCFFSTTTQKVPFASDLRVLAGKL